MNRTTGSDSLANRTPEAVVRVDPEFFNVEDASAVLRLSEREIYRLIDDGEIAVYPYKRRKMLDPASVHRLADKIRSGAFAPLTLAAAA